MKINGIGNMRYEVYRIHAHLNLIAETAKVVYGEAGGVVDDEERLWIAYVVRNRHSMKSKYNFGNIRKDFAGYKRWEKNWKSGKIIKNPIERKAWEKSMDAAIKAWTSNYDPTNGAVFFVSKEYLKEKNLKEKKQIKDPYDPDKVNRELHLSLYKLEKVKEPEGHNFKHVFYRIKEK